MAPKLPRWYLAYFVLAAFDVLTVTGGLFLNHTIVQVFSASVQKNKLWATNLSSLEDLRRLAGEVNAPGNDVFDSRDVPKETQRAQQAKALFDAQLKKIEDDFTAQQLSDGFLQELHTIKRTLSSMIDESNKIFGFFQSNQADLAGERMATMDREYAAVNASIAALNKHIQSTQIEELSRENETAEGLQGYEYLIAAFIVFMILGASLYGYKIHQQMLSSALEREKILQDLLVAKEQAEAAAKAKNDFLTMMSHEIRTPMNGIVGVAELLQLSELTTQQRQHVATIQSSAQALSAIINDVLDFAKIEAGKMSTQTLDFNLLEVFEDTLSTLAPLAHKKGLELLCKVEPSLPEHLKGDPFRFRQVLVNLVGNAVKFTEEGFVQLSASVSEKTPSEVVLRIEVTDTGMGISESEQKMLFTAFTQTSNVNVRKHGGTGLGLAICKRIVEALGGEIGLKSATGQGSTFWFTARFTRRSTTNPDPLPTIGNVLIIDDNKINRQILKEQLESWKIPNDSAANGVTGLSLLKEAKQKGSPYSLAILDFHMPGMSGLDVAKEIRAKSAEFGDVKLLLLASLDYSRESQNKIFDQSLIKPATRRSLLHSLNALFDPKHNEAQERIATEASSKKILLVEDNPVNQMVVVGMLNALGYNADIANNGQEAIDAKQRKPYDLIFMDCQMPVLDGYEATRRIRKDEIGHVPIVALTAHAVEGARQQVLDAGMDDYLSKPVSMAKLKEMLSLWLSGVKAEGDSVAAQAPTTSGETPLREDVGVSQKIIDLFAKLGPGQVQDIISAPDAQSRRDAAHKLKGGALSIGLPRLAEVCLQIELRSKNNEDPKELFQRLQDVFAESLAALISK